MMQCSEEVHTNPVLQLVILRVRMIECRRSCKHQLNNTNTTIKLLYMQGADKMICDVTLVLPHHLPLWYYLFYELGHHAVL